MVCEKCRSELDPVSNECNYCKMIAFQQEEKSIKTLTIISLVSAFVLSGIVAFILAVVSKNNVNKLMTQGYEPSKETKSLANASLIVSIVALVLRIFLLVIIILLIIKLPEIIEELQLDKLLEELQRLN